MNKEKRLNYSFERTSFVVFWCCVCSLVGWPVGCGGAPDPATVREASTEPPAPTDARAPAPEPSLRPEPTSPPEKRQESPPEASGMAFPKAAFATLAGTYEVSFALVHPNAESLLDKGKTYELVITKEGEVSLDTKKGVIRIKWDGKDGDRFLDLKDKNGTFTVALFEPPMGSNTFRSVQLTHSLGRLASILGGVQVDQKGGSFNLPKITKK